MIIDYVKVHKNWIPPRPSVISEVEYEAGKKSLLSGEAQTYTFNAGASIYIDENGLVVLTSDSWKDMMDRLSEDYIRICSETTPVPSGQWMKSYDGLLDPYPGCFFYYIKNGILSHVTNAGYDNTPTFEISKSCLEKIYLN